jgi:hypothetical protein
MSNRDCGYHAALWDVARELVEEYKHQILMAIDHGMHDRYDEACKYRYGAEVVVQCLGVVTTRALDEWVNTGDTGKRVRSDYKTD